MSKTFNWEHDGARWQIELEFGVVAGRVECLGLRIEPSHPDEPAVLSRQTVRAIPLGRFVDSLRQDSSDLRALVKPPGQFGITLGELAGAGLGPLRDKPKRGRPVQIDRAHLSRVADVYLRSPNKPTLAVSEEFSVSRATAGRWVGMARDEGLLDPTSRGRASGRTGDK